MWVGLAGRGQRPPEVPPPGWIKIGPDSCVDPDTVSIHHRRVDCYGSSPSTVLWVTRRALLCTRAREHPDTIPIAALITSVAFHSGSAAGPRFTPLYIQKEGTNPSPPHKNAAGSQ